LSTIINGYLDSLKSNLRLDAGEEKEVISELATHIEDEVQELKKKGFKEDEAASTCLKLLGSAKLLAHLIYESRSQGTWRQALMASLPHVLFGLIFILNSWRGIGPLLMALIGILSITVHGWWHGKSNWLFPWLGYSLLPVIAAGLALLYLPEGLDWLAILIYVPLAVWLVLRVIRHTLKKDWIYLSLMLLPLPAIIAWFVVTGWKDGFNIDRLLADNSYAPWIGLSFLVLGLGVISFVRIRRRWLKIAVLFITGSTILVLVSSYTHGQLTLTHFLLLLLLQISIFLIPAFIENVARSRRIGKNV
jgi:hypothetical protein